MIEEKPSNDAGTNTAQGSKEGGQVAPKEPKAAATQPSVEPTTSQKNLGANPANEKPINEIKERKPIPIKIIEDDVLKPFERKTLTLAWAGVIIAIITGIVFYRQFREMQTQTGILSQQAEDAGSDARIARRHARQQIRTTQEQVDAIQRQMRQDQRAWISYTVETVGPSGVPAVGHPFLIRITVKNIGKSAAIKLMTCTAADFLPKEKLPTFECPGPGKHYISGGTIFPGSWNFGDLVLTQTFLQTDRDKIMSNNWNVWVYGRIQYRDVFAVEHWFNFCDHLLSGGAYSVCDQHTEIDNN